MAATPNGDKALQDANTGAAQPSTTDYKAVLDKVAAKSQDDSSARASSRQDGVLTKLVDQGKHLLGVNSDDDGTNDKLASAASESRPGSSEHIADTHVQAFLQDAHRSHKITPKADGI